MRNKMGAMMTGLYWVIPNQMAGMMIPFIHPERRVRQGGGLCEFDDDLVKLHAAGIRGVVCLLNRHGDEAIYRQAGFSFLCLPVDDGMPPTVGQVREAVAFIDRQLAAGNSVAVHCQGGLGRTGTMLAAYLIVKGDSADEAIQQVRSAEPAAIESSEQEKFLQSLASDPAI